MLHFIRDLNLLNRDSTGTKGGGGSYNGNQGEFVAIMYWFLRLLGYSWQWECSGRHNPANKLPDGDMEAVGVGNWSGSNATVVKDSLNQFSGSQCLEITAAVISEYAESDLFTNIDSILRTYHLVLRAANNTGSPWDVQIDSGGGYISVGSIPHNSGSMTQYHYTFTSTASGQLRIVAPGSGTIYVDEAHVFYSFYEFVPDQGVGDLAPPFGASPTAGDGQFVNGDEFSSGSYTFVAGDIGKILIAIDTGLYGNSGAYEITGISSGNAVLDLRVAGNEVLQTPGTAACKWRMLDLDKLPRMAESASSPTWFASNGCGSGFVLESPHANKWRFGLRNDLDYGSTWRHSKLWASPIDGAVDVNAGDIYAEFASSMRAEDTQCERPAAWGSLSNLQYLFGAGIGETINYARCHLMASDGGEFFMAILRRVPSGADAAMLCGILNTSDPLHSQRECFTLMAKNTWGATDELGLSNDAWNCLHQGCCGTESNEMAVALVGAEMRTVNFNSIDDADAGPSPYSGEEWRHRPILVRDSGRVYGEFSEVEADIEDALWFMRSSLTSWVGIDPINGVGDGTTAKEIGGTAPNMTLKDTDAKFTSDMVGKEITIAGCSNGGNNGTFVVTGYSDASNIAFTNASGVAESPLGVNVTWQCFPQLKTMRRGLTWKSDGFTGIV